MNTTLNSVNVPHRLFHGLTPFALVALLFFAAACAEPAPEDAPAEADTAAAERAVQAPGLVDVIMDDPRLSTFATALDTAGLVETLRAGGPYTVFAPTNEAIEALPEGTVNELLRPKNQERLQSILTYHVVAGELTADEVMAMPSAMTLEGADLAIAAQDSQVIFNPEAANPATAIEADIQTSNGVIHVIDAVLMPPEETASEM